MQSREATANCRGADGVQPAVVPMEQPAPTMAQNTNDDEEEEILIDTEEQVVFTLAEVGRRADGDGIDTESPCIGPLRAVQLLKVASQHGVLERLPLTTEQRALKEKLVAIKAAASSCIEISAVPFFGNLAKRGIAPSARDAAVSDSLCRKTERVFRKRADNLDTSDVRRAGFDLRRLARGFGERRKPGLSREWQNSFKERNEDAYKAWMGKLAHKGNLSQWGHDGEEGYERALKARVSKLEEVADGTLPDGATGLNDIRVGGFSLGSWNQNMVENDGNIINRMILDYKPLVERLAALADKDYEALVRDFTWGFRTARSIHRMALTCKKLLDDDLSPVTDDELLKNSNFGRYTIDEEMYQLLHLRNAAIRKGIPVDVAERVMNWEVISYKAPGRGATIIAQPQFIDPDLIPEQKRKSGNKKTNKFCQPSLVFKHLDAPTKDQLKTMLEPGNCDLCKKGKPKLVEGEPGKWCCNGYYDEKSLSVVPCSQTWTDATLPRKHHDSLLSDAQLKEEFVAELRYLGASPEVVKLVSQKWSVLRLTSGKNVGKWRGYIDENKKIVESNNAAKKRFGVATSAANGRGVSKTEPAAAEPSGILDSDDEKDRNFLDTVYRSSKAEQISGSAPAPAPIVLDDDVEATEDVVVRATMEASAKEHERFMTEQEAKLYGQIGSQDEKKESDSLSSDEPKYLGTNPPPADAAAISMYDFGVHPNAPPPAVAPVPVAAPAQVEVAEEPTPASSPRPPRDLDLVDSEEAKKVERDYDDEAEF